MLHYITLNHTTPHRNATLHSTALHCTTVTWLPEPHLWMWGALYEGEVDTEVGEA